MVSGFFILAHIGRNMNIIYIYFPISMIDLWIDVFYINIISKITTIVSDITTILDAAAASSNGINMRYNLTNII